MIYETLVTDVNTEHILYIQCCFSSFAGIKSLGSNYNVLLSPFCRGGNSWYVKEPGVTLALQSLL